MKNRILSFIAVLIVLSTSTFAQTFKASSTDGRNQATFESDAPLENIVGVTNHVDVTVMLKKDDIKSHAMGKVKVDLRTLKTGIELRDEHLKSPNWLNTEKYPFVEFMMTGIKQSESNSLQNSKKVTAQITGKFTLHGVTKVITVPANLTYFQESEITKKKISGNLLKVRSTFDINLTDYGIEIPSMVVGKVNNSITVGINFIASDSGTQGNPCGCNPCGAKKCNPCKMKNKCNPCKMKK